MGLTFSFLLFPFLPHLEINITLNGSPLCRLAFQCTDCRALNSKRLRNELQNITVVGLQIIDKF